MAGTTTNLALPYPSSTDPDNVPGDIQNLANAVEGLLISQGLFANRPASGHRGAWYFSTDKEWISRDDGSTWHDFQSVADANAAYAPIGSTVFKGARAYASATTAVANATPVPVALASESFDSGTLHDNVTNNARITVPTTGKYTVHGAVSFTGGTGMMQARIHVNGSAVTVAQIPLNAGNGVTALVSDVLSLTAGDYIELAAFQTSGGSLNVGTGSSSTYLAVAFSGT